MSAATPPALTPGQERQLYHSDRAAWLRIVAPRAAALVPRMSDDGLAALWSNLPRDYQTALWHALNLRDQTRVRTLRDAANITVAAA